MDSSRFSSPRSRSDCFPAGLRVLVVDDDPAWLKILEKMLKKCNYQVTTCNLMREALDLLQERKDGFDIVISDVNMADMDGFKLLEHVGLKMDLPVIMMSVDGETSRVMKGVQHGACDYLLKPIRMKELRNIWQHVFRKRIQEVRDIEGTQSIDEVHMTRNATDESDGSYSISGDTFSGKKRKDLDKKNHERECSDSSSVKKARVVWTVDLHRKFVQAVNHIGLDKVGPKKILDLMGVPWLTRENVASHLQKYRLYLSRLQKENDLKAAPGGIMHSDISSESLARNVCLQSSIDQNLVAVQQNIVRNENCGVDGHMFQIHSSHGAKICGGNVKGMLSMPITGEALDSPVSSTTSRISFSHSFGPMDSEVKSQQKIQAQYSWSAEVPSIQLKQELKSHFQSEHRFDNLPLPMPRVQVDYVSHNPLSSSRQADRTLSYCKNRGYGIGKVTKVENIAALISVQPQSHLTNCLEPIPCSTWSTKNHSVEHNLESSLKNLIVGTRSALGLWDEEFNGCSSQGGFNPQNPALVNYESFDYSNEEVIADVLPQSCEECEYPSDQVEYLVMDQGLHIA